MTNAPMTAWVEIPVADLAKAVAYYNTVFGWASKIVTDMGPDPVAHFNNGDAVAGGHLYEGKPAAGVGPTVHLAVAGKLEDVAQRVEPAGGHLVGPIVEIPAGRFQYTLDPDGNSIGLFEGGAP